MHAAALHPLTASAIPLLRGPEELSAPELADLCLLALARRGSAALLVTPSDDASNVTLEEGGETLTILALPPALGDAVALRLALLARLDVGAASEQLGRLRVAAGGGVAEFLAVLRPELLGVSIELRRVASPREPGRHQTELTPAARVGIYRVNGELGRGGMGVVYRAVHETLGKPVALKVLYGDYARDPDVCARFVREARAASRVRHPGIVDVTDFGTLSDGRTFLVMELVEAPTLEQVLRAEGPLAPARAVLLAARIASALDAAHGAGVVHRDLKPANVFVLPGEEVKVADFGAAKIIGGEGPSDTQRGDIFGTPYYMSPEHARGESTDRRTDVYALGCVLVELLTGKVPFDGGSSVEVLTQHLTAPPPPVVSPHGPLPELLERVLARALAKRVTERYQTAAELAADLDRALVALGRSGWRRWLPS